MKLINLQTSIEININNINLLHHSNDEPAFFVGTGKAESNFYRGNFKVFDRFVEREVLEIINIKSENENQIISLKRLPEKDCEVLIIINCQLNTLAVKFINTTLNRFWVRFDNEAGEHLWGGGEQFSHFNLSGKRVPIWTQEPGVGRDQTTRMAMIAEVDAKAGAHETATYYPQPTFISSRQYALHINTSAYSVLDFTSPMFHEVEVWDNNFNFEFFYGESILNIVQQLAKHFGHCGHIPQWVYNGVILGLKRGFPRNLEILELAIKAGINVSGLWCEDWCGLRQTSFGMRLFWDWQWNKNRYPDLPQKIKELNKKGIKFLAYNNPYLCSDGPLFKEAQEKNLLTKNPDGSICEVDFGEFNCGFVDFTSEAGRKWYKERIIKENMLSLGISGWMADFGEYQPTQMVTQGGEDGWLVHNCWPELWARVNAEAIAEAGLSDEILFFMRAGFSGSQKYCKLLWAGDQLVDFSRHDGMQTAICAALSAGMVGNTICHSDIGGYTTLYGNNRTEEVFMRWAEMNAFTPVMRTHESNRPDESFQFYQSDLAIKHLAQMTKIYKILVPYLQSLSAEAVASGTPIQRPLLLHFQDDRNTWAINDQYLYGEDLLIAPVHKSAVKNWRVYLPKGENWVHLWSDKEFAGGQTVSVAAPLGNIPAFYKKGSKWSELFNKITSLDY